MGTPAFTAIAGFADGYYEGPAGTLAGRAQGFSTAAVCFPFTVPGVPQTVCANSDDATQGWLLRITGTMEVEVVLYHTAGSISVTHNISAAGFGRFLQPALTFDGTTLTLVINGSAVGTAAIPGGEAYVPSALGPTFGTLTGGAEPMLNTAFAGMGYTSQALNPVQDLQLLWLGSLASRDMVDAELGGLYPPTSVPTFEHLYSARRRNSGFGTPVLPGAPGPVAAQTWPDDRGTGGAVDFTLQNGPLFVVCGRDLI